MKYEFPIIEHIGDVLPAMEGFDEFFVAQRDNFKVVNYRVAFARTFEINDNDVMLNHGKQIPKGIMQRELRGIVFDQDGCVVSRPFHKFFNVGEREETALQHINLSQPHMVTEKMDGSMVRPFRTKEGEVRLGTKMLFSDVADAANEIATDEQLRRMGAMMREGITPLFEFISPNNRIVVEYDKAELVLLALRVNRTGEYLDIEEWRNKNGGLFRVVPQYGSVKGASLKKYINKRKGAQGREGDVLVIGNMRYKIKNDWYLRAHKTKAAVLGDKDILALLLENELDDLLPTLGESDLDRVRQFEARFRAAYDEKLAGLRLAAESAIREADGDRKELARVVLPGRRYSKIEQRLVFGAFEGSDMGEMLTQHIRASLSSKARYAAVEEFLGLA